MDKLMNYFDQRYRANLLKGDKKECGPIITISRQTGCDAIAVAKQLVLLLNKKYNTNRWRWIDKQILTEAAKQLKTDRSRVETYVKGSEFSGLSDMIKAISGDYISDLRIRKAIMEVVLTICNEGYAVLVGRGGVSIARQVPKSLHIRLVAPFYWRVENIITKRNLNIEDAEEFVIDTDERRYNTIINFLEKKPLNIDYLFDATINRHSYDTGQISELILELYTRRIRKVKDEGNSPVGKRLDTIYG